MKRFYVIPVAVGIILVLSAYRVNAEEQIGAPKVGVDVQTPHGVDVHVGANAVGDNRPDQWRYKWENNRWWYWAPDNRWMTYSPQNGWVYADAPVSYATGYGSVPVAPVPAYVAPPTTYYYPAPAYYYPRYYGRPGIYIGGPGWGVRVGRGRWWW